jgi:hypothetical protein
MYVMLRVPRHLNKSNQLTVAHKNSETFWKAACSAVPLVKNEPAASDTSKVSEREHQQCRNH